MKFSVNSIALSNIKNRKKQYILLFTGIVLSVYFTATALLFGYSVYTSLTELHSTRQGNQDVVINDCKNISFEELKEKGIFSEFGFAKALFTVLLSGEISGGGFNVCSFDETALKISGKRLLEGRFPQSEGEIALEQSAVAMLRQDININDVITLTITAPGLDKTVENEYTLVGIIKDQSRYQNQEGISSDRSLEFNRYPAGILSDSEQTIPGSLPVVKCYAKMTVSNQETHEKVDGFLSANSILNEYGYPSSEYTGTTFYFDGADYNIIWMMAFCIVIAIVLVLASCVGITNAFTSILDIKKHQIGLLRAVGATKKQIRTIFGREAVILALISIPFALIFSCLTVFAATQLMGEDYVFNLNILILILVAIFSMLIVILACILPLKRASAIPPMQAIRDADLSRRLKNKNVKSKNIFDVAKLIARRNIVLYKSKMFGITLMLIITIVLFCTVNFFVGLVMQQIGFDYASENGDYTIEFHSWTENWLMEEQFHAPGITEQDKLDAQNLDGISKVSGSKNFGVKILVDKVTPYLTQDGYGLFSYLLPTVPNYSQEAASNDYNNADQYNEYLQSKEKYGYNKDYLTVGMTSVDEDVLKMLESFVIEGKINTEKLNNGEEILLIAPKEYSLEFFEDYAGSYINYEPDVNPQNKLINDVFFLGDEMDLSLLYTDSAIEYEYGEEKSTLIFPEDVVRLDKKVKIGAILTPEINGRAIHSLPVWLRFTMPVGIITSNTGLSSLGFDVPYKQLTIYSDKNLDTKTEEYLETNLTKIADRTPDVTMTSYIAMSRETREFAIRFIIAAASIIILLYAICVSMLNNAISARIRAGKREIGTLRAVGASKIDVKKSYFWQLLSMFIFGTILGITGGMAVCAILNAGDTYLAISKAIPFPVWQTLLFVLIMFGLCYMNIHTKVNRILKNNVVENIREL